MTLLARALGQTVRLVLLLAVVLAPSLTLTTPAGAALPAGAPTADPFASRILPADGADWATSPRAGAHGKISARKQPLGTYNCERWKKHPFLSTSKQTVWMSDCARFKKVNKRFERDYATDFVNRSRTQTVPWSCEYERTTGWDFEVSSSVEAEAGAIFAKAKVSVSASVSYSVSTTVRSATSFKVKPRKTAYCLRGAFTYDLAGNTRTRCKIRDNQTGAVRLCWWRGTYESFSGNVPSHTRHIFGDGPVPS